MICWKHDLCRWRVNAAAILSFYHIIIFMKIIYYFVYHKNVFLFDREIYSSVIKVNSRIIISI